MGMTLDINRKEEGEFMNSTNKPGGLPTIPEQGEFKTGRAAGLPPVPETGEFDKGSAPQKSGYCGPGSR